ncbi:hypothetical protein C900_01773 [Fulvivirga imtechensis AK7]|uniref:Outer membrane protein beta-barrel domain-containing protein n=1 Tax=Fulvivirga imtechensis AK7 TaxID=1237149 RepID=L8JX68_9BACT|nr:hypothetical protein [Fulvivirga imtechensis]ELR72219.1 hypothetical protein C900_01773 [Fulvivirga imtechensis AK7]
MRKIVLLFSLFTFPLLGFSQGLDADNYESEFIWGINKNTSGGLIGGFVIRSSKRINDRLYQSIGFELVNVKHPLEVRRNSRITGNLFIYGKSNYLYALRGQYGRELILFRKAPQQGVEIKAVVAIGPSIGILAPYYIDYDVDGNITSIDTKKEQYDPNKHKFQDILGTGHVLQGIQESKIKLGGNFKAALSFELGTLKSHVTGFEAGFLLDAYTEEITLMPTAENNAIFPTAFITLFYGKRR